MTNATIIPTIGRIVWYRLSAVDVSDIARHRLNHNDGGNSVAAGDVYPAMIVRVHGNTPDAYCNLKVMLDGPDTHWATSRKVGAPDEDGAYHWMPYQVSQAKKHEGDKSS